MPRIFGIFVIISLGDSSLYRKFISKFDTNDSLVWSTAIIRFFSDGDNKNVFGMESVISPRIAVNDSGNIYMIGTTWDLAYTYMGNGQYYYENTIGDYGATDPVSDAVVTGFDGLDNSLVISTFLGGEGFESSAISPRRGDVGLAIATFLDDRVYVGGFTYSKSATPFPTYDPTPVNSYFQENCVSCDIICSTTPIQRYCSDGFVGQIKKGILTGIEESPSESAIIGDFPVIAYPNPANDQITIKFSLYDKTELYFAVYNIIGEVVYSESQKYRAGTFEKQLDLSHHANGMYLIQVKSEKINHSLKIIKE